MTKAEPYRDFVLCEANHLTAIDFIRRSDAKIEEVLERNLKLAKKAILEETKPGDLILIEAPIVRMKELGPSQHLLGAINGIIINQNLVLKSQNFYHDIAEYARQMGRVVRSIDSGIQERNDTHSSLKRINRLGNSREGHISAEAKLAYNSGRNPLMEKRIQKLKPKMVLVAEAHAAWIEHRLLPKKVILAGARFLHPDARKEIYEHGLKEIWRLNYLRKARRLEINKRLGLDKPKPKPPAHKP